MNPFYNNIGQQTAYGLVKNGYMASEKEKERLRKFQTEKMVAYYSRDNLAIRFFLVEHLKCILKNPQNITEIVPVVDNYVPKVLKRLCQVYVNPPVFKLDSENEQKVYDVNIMPELNKNRKEFHRLGKLLNTILVRPIWNEKKNNFRYLTLHRGNCDIETNDIDTNELLEVRYPVEIEERDYIIVWTDSEHYAIDKETGRRVALEGMNEDFVNPYGKIPFAVLKFEECQDDFFGDGLTDLVNMNESINGRLSDMMYKSYMQFGVFFGRNLGKTAEQIVISPSAAIIVDEPGDGRTSGAEFLTPDHNITGDIDSIDWLKRNAAITYGLPADAFSNDATAQSGYAKMIESLELLANNEDDEAALRSFEYQLFDLMKSSLEISRAKIRFNGNIESIQFNGMKFPETIDEVIKRRDYEIKTGLKTVVDHMREDNPDMTEEQALARLEENVRIRQIQEAKSKVQLIMDQANSELPNNLPA